MEMAKTDWSNPNPFRHEIEQPSSALPRRVQSVSRRSSRSTSNNNPFNRSFRPDHHRSFSSGPFLTPLEKSRQHQKSAHGSPHLRKVIPTDTIDNLDTTGLGPYHHEGPYDATLASRQIPGRAPVDAVKYGNAAALAATPRANIIDSLTRKVPLQGVGSVPSGATGLGGEQFDYEEEDIMHLEGKLGRWPGVDYRDEDVKGKGEPGYTQDLFEGGAKVRKRGKAAHSGAHGDGDAIEMWNRTDSATRRKRSVSDASNYARYLQPDSLPEGSGNTDGSGGLKRLGSLKKRFSLRRKKNNV